MKSILSLVVLAGLAAVVSSVQAQTAEAGAGGGTAESHQREMLSFMPKADQDKVIADYNKALADNADLKSDQLELQKEREGMESADDATRQAFMGKAQAYMAKLRVDMVKEDASVAPLLDEVDKKRAEMMGGH